jgi:methionine aminopeptidase
MISLKSKREIETMAKAGKILQQVFVETKKMIRSGLTTRDVDVVAEKNDSIVRR